MYKIFRNILFCLSPEKAHKIAMGALNGACAIPLCKKIIAKNFATKNDTLHKNIFGLSFPNCVGLAAGFDKNAQYLSALEALGFGFVEIGTVTPKPQPGNPSPRVFRLPNDLALINRMGFNNIGADRIAQRLYNRLSSPTFYSNMLIGGNIGKNKITPNADAWQDYVICFETLFDVVDYFVVNVSSPNTPNLRELQEKNALRKILSQVQNKNQSKKNSKPLLLKIAPDLTQAQLDDIIDLSSELQLSGLIVTNTTITREALYTSNHKIAAIGIGGLSGKPLQKKATNVLQYIVQQTNHKLPVIASGGIFTGLDAQEKLQAGASLVQVWTGLVYEGPAIAKNICQYLSEKNLPLI